MGSRLRRLQGLVLLLAGLSCAPDGGSPVDGNGRLNLVLISLDTCRADRLSCYGNERRLTPNLDRLAAEGVRFEDCLAQSCVTAPSHMSLFTGQHVSRHGLQRNGDSSRPSHSLAGVLSRHGWRTAAFTGHGSLQERFGHGHGFDLFQSWIGEAGWEKTRHFDEVVPQAKQWLARSDEPFFLFVHGYDPHCPYAPPDEKREQYAGWYEGGLDIEDECSPPKFNALIRSGAIRGPEMRYISDLYDAEIAHADRQIGKLLDHLREEGLLERSLVVFVSDHGEALGTKKRFGHGALTPEILRVPWILRFPGGRYAGVRSEPVQLIDVFPTLLAAIGVPPPPGVQGKNLLPLLQGAEEPPEEEAMRLAQAKEAKCAFFGDRWMLFWRENEGQVANRALYDLEQDPLGVRNVYPEPGGVEQFDVLFARYAAWAATQAEDDDLFRGRVRKLGEEEDVKSMLEALGYGGGED